MIVVAFRDGKDIVGTVLFNGLPGIDPEWYRYRAALELSRKWRRTALECGDTEYVALTAQGVLAKHESFIDVVSLTEIKPCECCGLGEPQGTCHVCGQKNGMPKHDDGVCWSCRDPHEGPCAPQDFDEDEVPDLLSDNLEDEIDDLFDRSSWPDDRFPRPLGATPVTQDGEFDGQR